jgi:hypothetical protein
MFFGHNAVLHNYINHSAKSLCDFAEEENSPSSSTAWFGFTENAKLEAVVLAS